MDMPSHRPENCTGEWGIAWQRGLAIAIGLAIPGTCLVPVVAQAQETVTLDSEMLLRVANSLESYEILMLAIFGGAMSFALLSAFWLIRERSRIVTDNQDLKRAVSHLRVSNDRNEALLALGDQRTVVWNGPDDKATVLGSLPASSGTPENPDQFVQFGKWLEGTFSLSLQKNLQALRNQAQAFEMVVKSRSGGIIEVLGSTSGGYAILKFRDLKGLREELAELTVKHESLNRSFDHVEQLMARLPMPVWLRDGAGKLSWVNTAYSDAIDNPNPERVVEQNLELLDTRQRDTIHGSIRKNELYNDTLPATVAGDRRKLQVLCVETDTGSAGMAIDKSDVDELDRLLRETNESHSRMLDQMATAVAIFDKSQRLVFYNSSFQQLWKLDPGLLEGEPSNGDVLDAMRDGKLLPEHPDWRKWRDAQLDIYRAIEPVEEWWHLLDGQTLRVVASPRSQGGCTWIYENVTERLALESNYNALMRVQGETLDHLNEAVAVFGSNGQLKLFNPALEALWQEADIHVQEGLHISRIIDGWQGSVLNAEDLQAILGMVTGFDDARNQVEGRMELTDQRTMQYSIVPLPDSQTMLTLVDVTANVNFEKALRERAEALEASDLLKSKFIQHVSYELRAPLTSISGFGEILKSGDIGDLNAKQGEYLSHINEAACVLREIVDDILDLASIDAGTMTLQYDTVNLDALVQKSFEGHATAMKDKGLKAGVEIAEECEHIIADGVRLEQILSNIVSNAINFSPDGGMILVEAKRRNNMNEIRIMDQGPGIDPEQVEVIFDRFETHSTSSGKTGTGLGLSIVRGFMELHGGAVKIDTSYEDGTCFVCALPVTPDPRAEEAKPNLGNSLASVA